MASIATSYCRFLGIVALAMTGEIRASFLLFFRNRVTLNVLEIRFNSIERRDWFRRHQVCMSRPASVFAKSMAVVARKL